MDAVQTEHVALPSADRGRSACGFGAASLCAWSLFVGDAEGVDRRVDLHGGEGGLAWNEVRDRDRVIAAAKPPSRSSSESLSGSGGTKDVCHQTVTLTSAGSARVSRIDRSSGV
jgi:hypothetical protein